MVDILSGITSAVLYIKFGEDEGNRRSRVNVSRLSLSAHKTRKDDFEQFSKWPSIYLHPFTEIWPYFSILKISLGTLHI